MNTIYEIERINPYSNLWLETIWADPQLALELVKKELLPLNPALPNSTNISFGSWNTEYLWQAKAKHFIETYAEIASKHHVLALQEVSWPGLAIIAQHTGYNYIVSQPNSRGQAVGFLIHPRFTIKSHCEYSQLMGVYGISNLRPALRVDLIDKQSDMSLSIITVHLKSMLGGVLHTSPIRLEQLKRLMIALENSPTPTLIAGDFNCFLDTSDDINPLLNNGFSMVNRNNHTVTQSSGGRLDGLFYRNLAAQFKPKHYGIRNFWLNNVLGRSISDHGLLTWSLGE
jgi:exonuclease III